MSTTHLPSRLDLLCKLGKVAGVAQLPAIAHSPGPNLTGVVDLPRLRKELEHLNCRFLVRWMAEAGAEVDGDGQRFLGLDPTVARNVSRDQPPADHRGDGSVGRARRLPKLAAQKISEAERPAVIAERPK